MVLDFLNQRIKDENEGQEAVGGEERYLNEFKKKIHEQSIQTITINITIQSKKD